MILLLAEIYLLRTSAYNALEVSRLCAIYIDIELGAKMNGLEFEVKRFRASAVLKSRELKHAPFPAKSYQSTICS